MSPRLEYCPNEIIEAIVVLLDLDDIRNLRLSCRSLVAKATQDHFRSYYHSKRVEVARNALTELVDATRPGRLGFLVQELTLVGITTGWKINGKQLQYSPGETELALLSQVFSAIATHGKTGGLLSISLEVAIVQQNSAERLLPANLGAGIWKGVWQCAAKTFDVTMRALTGSKIPLGNLNVFNGKQSRSCSLACNELSCINLQNEGLAMPLSCLKTLSISLSDRIIEDLPPSPYGISRPAKEKDIRMARKKAMAESNFVGLAQLLQLSCSLDSLEIHYYRVETARRLLTDPWTYHERLIKQVVRSDRLPKLKRCMLRGIYAREDDLLAFIQRTATRHLFMENVTLSSGTFKHIFDYCTGENAPIEEYSFDDLFEMRNRVYFSSTGLGAHLPVSLHQSTPNSQDTTSLQKAGTEVNQPITYYIVHPGMLPNSVMLRNQHIQRLAEYGPPRV